MAHYNKLTRFQSREADEITICCSRIETSRGVEISSVSVGMTEIEITSRLRYCDVIASAVMNCQQGALRKV